MANLGSSDTPVKGQDFELPAGAKLAEVGGDLAIVDSNGNPLLRRDEAAGEWNLEGTDLANIGSLDTEVSQTDYLDNAGLSLWANARLQSEKRVPIPSFEKLDSNPILTGADAYPASDEIHWPSYINAAAVFDDPLGEHYIYYAPHTHDGCGLMYSDSIDGEWTEYGQIIDDNDCAEVDAIYNPDADNLRLYANTGNAKIKLYTNSTDGVTGWTDQGDVFTENEQEAHAGYARMHRTDAGWYMASWHKLGNDESLRVLHHSETGTGSWTWVELRAGDRDAPTGRRSGKASWTDYDYCPFAGGYLVAWRDLKNAGHGIRLGYTTNGIDIVDWGTALTPTETHEDDKLRDPQLFWADGDLHLAYAAGDLSGDAENLNIATADFSEVKP